MRYQSKQAMREKQRKYLSTTKKKARHIEEDGYKKEEQAEGIQKDKASSVLCSRHESKAKEVGKGSRKAMKGNGQRWSIAGASVPRKAFTPVQTPMRTLCSGLPV
jgi:hypothetical protein